MSNILLSICIPTYKRAGYLKNCLKAFLSQLSEENKPLVEIYVSNNDSPDNTTEVINEYLAAGHDIKYNVNSVNIGPDKNIASCFANARGKYVWIFSDDDFVMPGYLEQIITLLKQNDVGIVYMNGLWYDDEKEIVYKPEGLRTVFYDSQISFFDKVNYKITFASGNIINKGSLENKDWINEFAETNLTQLSWMIPAIFTNPKNILIENNVLACKANNSGGYNFIKVFGKNFNTILDFFIAKGYNKKIKDIINIKLINEFFPIFIKPHWRQKESRKSMLKLIPVFWKYIDFWKIYFIVPIRNRLVNAK